MVDIHAHLLSSKVSFNRAFDKLGLLLFGGSFGFDSKQIRDDPYLAYTDALVRNIKSSKYLKKSVLFGVDGRIDKLGNEIHRDLTVCATNDELLNLYQKHSEVIIPFFSINPNRKDALDLIDKYYHLGFRGAKFLQNYWGVDLNQKRFIPYYDKLVEYDLPLIIHIGSESSIHSDKEYEDISMLNLPLQRGVKVIAAHMALSYTIKSLPYAFSRNPRYFNKEYFTLLKMLELHPNLYADLSAILTPVRAKVLWDLSNRIQIHHKLLFGTDFPVPWSVVFNTHGIPFKRSLQLSKVKNHYDRYIETLYEFFPKKSPIFSNYERLIVLQK